MKQVAKLVIVDGRGKYLLMHRSDHPRFGNDPDLPGGTLEEGELPLETLSIGATTSQQKLCSRQSMNYRPKS